MGRRWKWVAGLLILAAEAHAAEDRGFSVSVLVNGAPVSELRGRGSVYVEAVRGRRYAVRITNPLPYRVAVALSVRAETRSMPGTPMPGARRSGSSIPTRR